MVNNSTAGALAQALSTKTQQVVIVTKGEVQHIKVYPGYVYELRTQDGEVLGEDANLIARKVGSDLEVLLEDNTTVIFDNYFNICTPDLSCLVSLPSTEGVYYVVDGSFTTLADGSQIVHSYGDVGALSTIAKGQSSAFESSFNELFLTEYAFTYLPLLALGGGGSSSGDNNDPTEPIYPEDYISGGWDQDGIIGTAANDYIRGGGGNDGIEGGEGDDILYGNDGDDGIEGNAGDDFLYGNEGDDMLYGNEGDDYIEGGAGDDYIEGGAGDDMLYGNEGDDSIGGYEGDDYIEGNAGDDFLYGYEGDDYIEGNAGDDFLYGYEGDDYIEGGAGDDYIEGGAGKDEFMYSSISDGNDEIFDFQTGTGTDADVLDLSRLLTYIQGDIITNFISFIDDGVDTIVNIDADGDASGTDVSITLLGVTGVDLNTMITDSNIVL